MKLDLPSRIQRTLSKGSNNLSGRLLTRQISYIIDSSITGLFHTINKEKLIWDKLCLIAIGGYGRMELAPHSDIDLLYLHDNMEENLLSEVISRINNFLYDSGMQVGHTCRTIEESKLYIDNIQTFHAILDSRYLVGSELLYAKYEKDFLENFPQDLVNGYNKLKLDSLEKNILSSHTPLLLTEPNIKNGPLGLRDIQAIYWIEKTLNENINVRRTGIFDFFTHGDTLLAVQAYDFFLRTRVILHKISGRKNDRLDLALQPDLAEEMGFGPRGLNSLESFVSTYYKYQKEVYHFIATYLDYRAFRPTATSHRTISKYGLQLVTTDKYLYPPHSERLFANPDSLYQDVISVFLICQEEGKEPSPTLLNELRFASNFLDDDFKNSKIVIEHFLTLIKNLRNVGKMLSVMHDANILGAMFPEFGACTNFPLFSYHHEYPVDEHSLLILRELDLLVSGDYPDKEVLEVFANCEKIHILYLALLVHDAGKVKEGDHCQYGSELALAISDRLALSDSETDLFRFLVAHHIDMSEISNKRDIFDPNLIQEFAEIVTDIKRLSLLYVLTIIDTKSVGPSILTNWKKDILYRLYISTKEFLDGGSKTFDTEESNIQGLKNYLQSKEQLPDNIVFAVCDFAQNVKPTSYLNFHTHRRILQHFTQLQVLKQNSMLFNIEYEKEPSYTTITVYSHFRRDVLLHIAGAVSSLDLNLVGMRPFRLTDDRDDFLISQVLVTDSIGSGDIPSNTLDIFRSNLDGTLAGRINLEESAMLSNKWSEKTEVPEGLVDEMVEFNNTANEIYTILEIRLSDSIGLLYRILEVLLSQGIEIHFARVATSADFAYDTFYLLDKSGSKLEDQKQLTELRQKIFQAANLLLSNQKSDMIQEIYF
ncbi:hypothetical protein [Leptospira sp. GIMC2001]|uniref:[protein-PII] uridylyltransferase family protein n=1 Tax=Leptospira sp. GIMC2001 TaxID=1513297 RepID=UPI002349363E|nr:hypothetical protein [Leptospira sp. GIMC2001]WCL49368.1 hypothetical protein O4O04_19075 [Leptospira sp. GIMC2001]